MSTETKQGNPSDQDQRSEGFLPGKRIHQISESNGVLKGLQFAVKDNIDIQGCKTGAGNPHWAETHPEASQSAQVIEALLAAGASIVGKTISEELAYSVIGDNQHYGIPLNVATPSRFPGGSSSGSATVVAAGEADFSLGTDTAGSVRIPASNCGLFGFRPTHGSLNMDGVLPLASSFDTIGWFTNDAHTLNQIGEVLLPPSGNRNGKHAGYFLYEPAFSLLSVYNASLCKQALEKSQLPCSGHITKSIIWPQKSRELAESLRVLQAAEAWQEHGSWVSATPKDTLSEEIRSRFYFGKGLTTEDRLSAERYRQKLIAEVESLLDEYGVIAIPTVSQEALTTNASESQRQLYRQSVIQMTCLSSLCGLPEVSIPLVNQLDFRMGISLVGRANSDRKLLEFIAEHLN